MKKILVMSALVAISTAFVACSNENDLVQQKPEVPETPTERYPMTVTVSDPTSRGTDLTADDLKSFSMYSTIDASWQATATSKVGAAFAKNPTTGVWSNTNGVEMSWPSTTADYTFYAVNDVANMTSAPTVTSSSVSFGYAMPIKAIDTNDDGDPDDYYYDYADQVDLLVAKKTAKYTDGDPDGSINVTFQHALAQIRNIYVYCDASKMEEEDANNLHLRVNGIKLGGLKAAGTYTFNDGNGSWAVSGDDAEYEIPLAINPNDEAAFTQMSFMPDADKTKGLKLPRQTGDGGLYVIPQSVSGEVTDKTTNNWDYNVIGAYADIHLQAASTAYGTTYILSNIEANPDGDDYGWNWQTSKANGFQWVRCPLTFNITAGSGKYYNLYLDLTKAVIIEDSSNNNAGGAGQQAIPSNSIEFGTE